MASEDNKTVQEIRVPDIGDSTDVEVIEVLVDTGDHVNEEDSLITLESDKASMEVPSPVSGTLVSLAVATGSTVNTGDLIATVSVTAGKDPASADNGSAGGDATVDDDAATAEAGDSGSTTTDSSATGAADTGAANDAAAAAQPGAAPPPATASGPTVDNRSGGASTIGSPTAHLSDENQRKAHASPAVRRYAREHGADLSLVGGSGPKGRILKPDVTAYIKQAIEGLSSSYGGVSGGGAGIPAVPEVDFTRFGEIDRVELGRINKLSAKNLHRAWLNLPMVTHHDEADITGLEAFRKELKQSAGPDDPKITGLAFHMKALVNTLQAFPKFNASLAADGEALIYKKYFHIGIAVDTPNGLVVPVFRDVDTKSVSRLAEEMADTSVRARAKKLKPDEMQGASMTISSLGGIGGTAFTPIVNPPEVAILGITRARMQPVWNGTEFVPRLMCPLDLTYDHRVIDGADAARFMVHYCKTISDIRRLVL